MLALTNLLNDTAAGTLTLETLQSAFQVLALTDPNLRHLVSLLSLIPPVDGTDGWRTVTVL